MAIYKIKDQFILYTSYLWFLYTYVIICMFFDSLNLTFCSSFFYLNCFFLPKLSLLFILFLLFSLNICTTSSQSSSVLSFMFHYSLSSSIAHWSLGSIVYCVISFQIVRTMIALPLSYNYFSGSTCVAWFWWCPWLYLLCTVPCIFPLPFIIFNCCRFRFTSHFLLELFFVIFSLHLLLDNFFPCWLPHFSYCFCIYPCLFTGWINSTVRGLLKIA